MSIKLPNKKLLAVVAIFALSALIFLISPLFTFAITLDTTINPQLDISRFLPYKIYVSNIERESDVTAVSLLVRGLNGNTTSTNCWDYYVEGICNSSPINYNLTYNSVASRWESPNIYPDQIYPEIYFASSATTWYNTPLTTALQRDSYSILKFSNPFDMVGDMNFWIEVDAVPRAANSADLEIYLVGGSVPLSTFGSDWRESPYIEQVGVLNSLATFHHIHSPSSAHHLISLATNANGTIGTKNIDISQGFWMVMYSKAPNNARGWDLRYHPSTICNHPGYWYSGSQFGWTVDQNSGCPDVHIHIARRSSNMDGVSAIATVTYSDNHVNSKETDFYFGVLPNLPPNSTDFHSPSSGTYSGTISVTWDPASDANNDVLTYTIDLLNADESLNKTIVSNTLSTNTTFNTGTVADASYRLRGTVCDSGALCTQFYSDTFTVENTSDIASLQIVTILGSGADPSRVTVGDVVTLRFTATATLLSPNVTFYSGGHDLSSPTVQNISGNEWIATVEIKSADSVGRISFDISSGTLDKVYSETSDVSVVYIYASTSTNDSNTTNQNNGSVTAGQSGSPDNQPNPGTDPTDPSNDSSGGHIVLDSHIKTASALLASIYDHTKGLMHTFELDEQVAFMDDWLPVILVGLIVVTVGTMGFFVYRHRRNIGKTS